MTSKINDGGPVKPCPFCGSEAEMEAWHGGGPDKQLIRCAGEACDASPSVTGETPTEAIAAWNKRASVTACNAYPDMLAALKECQAALAMVTEPKAIAGSSVLNAFALCTAAEVKARAAIARAEGGGS